jgi:hypothetical protein
MAKKSMQGMMYEEVKAIHIKVDKILQEKLPELDNRVTKVEIKSGIWGGLSGVIGGVLVGLGFTR